jgi:hypothetical protein
MNPQARQRRFQRICEIGCICCRQYGRFSPCQVHHQNMGQHAGQKRLGDEATVGLCPWHHVGEPPEELTTAQAVVILGPSMKHEPVRFRKIFGSDEELLAMENEAIAACERRVVGRIA